MKTILKIFFLFIILIINYSFGRPVDEWSQVTDTISINEWLTRTLKGLRKEYGVEAAISEVKNIICKTELNNGYHIKLMFDHQEKKWECILYKSIVETIRLKYEQCIEIPANNEEDDKIDKLNKDTKDKTDQKLNNDDPNMDEENQEKQPKQDDDQPPVGEGRRI